MKRLELKVGAKDSGARLDQYLASATANAGLILSRRKLRRVIDVGGVYVNGKRVRIASRQLARGDFVRVEYSEAALAATAAPAFQFDATHILYDAHGIVAVNKPPGLPSQATLDQSVRHVAVCLAPYLESRARPGQRPPTPILVHRLDKETSGILLLAMSSGRATWLTELFRTRKVQKTYWAICAGVPREAAFTESAPLSEIDKRTGDVRAVHAGGRQATTHVRLLATDAARTVSLVECRPETGRSHQIRVHLALNGLPILGDKRYGGPPPVTVAASLLELAAEHHMLHAARLQFVPAEGLEAVTLLAAPPPRFLALAAAAGLALPEWGQALFEPGASAVETPGNTPAEGVAKA